MQLLVAVAVEVVDGVGAEVPLVLVVEAKVLDEVLVVAAASEAALLPGLWAPAALPGVSCRTPAHISPPLASRGHPLARVVAPWLFGQTTLRSKYRRLIYITTMVRSSPSVRHADVLRES